MKYRNQLLHAILKYLHLAFLNTVHATHSHFLQHYNCADHFCPHFYVQAVQKFFHRFRSIWLIIKYDIKILHHYSPCIGFILYSLYDICLILSSGFAKKFDKCWILLQIFYRMKKYIFCICKIQSAIANKNLSHLTNKKVSQF